MIDLYGNSGVNVGDMLFLPSDSPSLTDSVREFLRSGVIVEGTAYPTFPSWLTQPAGGALWTQRTLPASANWTSVTYGNGVFVAVAGSPATIAATSTDGVSWTQRTLPVSAYWRSVTYGNGVFVAVASSSAIAATSTDGVSWTQRTLPVSASWFGVTYGNGVFVAVAGGPATIAATSDSSKVVIGASEYTPNLYLRIK